MSKYLLTATQLADLDVAEYLAGLVDAEDPGPPIRHRPVPEEEKRRVFSEFHNPNRLVRQIAQARKR